MRRAAIVFLLLVALPLLAAEKWWDAYKRGVASVQGGNYQAGIDALQRALTETPSEAASIRPRNETFTYVPHYWIGVAKFQLGDPDGALREWRTSEEQGAVQKTPLYADLRTWVGKAQSQKQRASDSAVADLKRDANAAVGRAVSAQMDALAAGGDRSETYRAAQRKLQEAMESANGADARAFRHASEVAQQARELFASAAEDAKKQKAVKRPSGAQSPPAVRAAAPPPVTATVAPTVPRPDSGGPLSSTGIESLPQSQTKITAAAVQPAAPPPPPPGPQPGQDKSREQLQTAYRAFAGGDFTTAEQMLSRIVTSSASGEAYLLRGCVRYTRATLARQPDMRAAVADFRAALRANQSLRLDRRAFSPKLVAFFDDIRRNR